MDSFPAGRANWLGHISALAGQYDEAREAAVRACDICDSTKALAGLGFVEARAGGVEAAESILETLALRTRTEYVAHSRLAAIYVALGQLPLAATSLQQARRDGIGISGSRAGMRAGIPCGTLGL